jgi:hypothetical protein
MTKRQRTKQVVRQWQILLALSDQEWFSLRQIRDCLADPPHMRTVRRDLEGLSEVFPIQRRLARQERIGSEIYQYRLRRPLAALLEKRKA